MELKRKAVISWSLSSALVASMLIATPGAVFATDSNPSQSTQETKSMADGLIVRYADKSLRKNNSIGFGFSEINFDQPVSAEKAEALASVLKQSDLVSFAEPNSLIKLSTVSLATNTSAASWGLDRIDQASLPLNGQYNYGSSGSGVKAYIIDSGIRATHNEFGGRVLPGFSKIDDGLGTGDCDGHGTHVAGTVGGQTYGVAKDVSLVPVRVFNCVGEASISDLIEGIAWVIADHSAGEPAVANMSFGTASVSYSVSQAVDALIADGVTVVAASGNENSDACNFSPASVPNAITVNASTNQDRYASFSNYGSCTDIYAPGVEIVSAGIYGNSDTETLSGTSMATPHVVGAVARILSAEPELSPAAVWNKLRSTASKFKNPRSRYDAQYMLFSPLGSLPIAATILSATVAPSGRNTNVTFSWSVPDQGSSGLQITGVTLNVYDKSTRGKLVGSCTPNLISTTSCTVSNLATGKTFYADLVLANQVGLTSLTSGRWSFSTMAAFSSTSIPVITYSSLTRNSKLVVNVPAWSPKATFKYQWLRNGSPINRATSSSYKISSSDLGASISVSVTGSASGYQPTTVTSSPVLVP